MIPDNRIDLVRDMTLRQVIALLLYFFWSWLEVVFQTSAVIRVIEIGIRHRGEGRGSISRCLE